MPSKRQSAYFRATQEAPSHSDTVAQPVQPSSQEAPSHSNTVTQRIQTPTQEAPSHRDTVAQPAQPSSQEAPSHSNTVTQRIQTPTQEAPSHRDTVIQRVKMDKKTSFYLSSAQEKKLNDLEAECWQRYSKKINRNEIVRYLIDRCDLDTLSGLIISETV